MTAHTFRTHTMRPILLCSLLLIGCASRLSTEVESIYTPQQIPAVLDLARTCIAENRDLESAFEHLRNARWTVGLTQAQQQEIQNVLEETTRAVIATSTETDLLEAIMDVDVPRRLAVEAGLQAARLRYAEGERMDAYRLIKRLDSKFPSHHERAAAGELLVEVGFDLAQDDRSYGLIFDYKSLAPEVLEYLVMNYPSHPGGDRSLWTLAELYQDQGDLEIAIEKHQDLMLWFPASAYVPTSQARIPHLRLLRHASPEYDRASLMLAKSELTAWLEDHAGHELEPSVQAERNDAISRLAASDLSIAHFYDTLDQPEGVILHARRALAEARECGDEQQASEADALLAKRAQEATGHIPPPEGS